MNPRRIRAAVTAATTLTNYRIAAASAAFLAVAATTGALMDPAGPLTGSEGTVPAAGAQAAIGAPGRAQVGQPAPGRPAPAGQPANPDLPAPPATPATPAKPPAPPPPAAKALTYTYQGQPNFYYCGPAATRIALSARKLLPSQDDLAARLRTTMSGTNSAEDTTRVLNSVARTNFYKTREITGADATRAEMDRLQADAVRAVSNGYAIVANVVGSATTADGRWLDWPGGHYITIVGYKDQGRMLKIADPANPTVSSYWISTIQMANWMGTRGYSA